MKIPGSVKTIEHKAFAGCHNLSEVVLSSGLENISDEAFKWCNALEKINFPKSLNYIGQYAFNQSDKLKDIVLHNKNISLGFEAFGADEGDSITGEDGNKYDFWISNVKTNVSTVVFTKNLLLRRVPFRRGYSGGYDAPQRKDATTPLDCN